MSIHPGGRLKSNKAPHLSFRQSLRLLVVSSLVAFNLTATSIQYQVTTNGLTGTYRYFVSGFVANQPCPNNMALQCRNELDILFDSAIFGQLSNGVAPAGFDLLLFQPNNPPQAPGVYSALATVNNPSLAGTYSVDFTTNPGALSESACPSTPKFCQQFSVNSFDSNGFFEGVAEPATGSPSEVTTPLVSGVPEPASFLLSGAALMVRGAVLALRRSVSVS